MVALKKKGESEMDEAKESLASASLSSLAEKIDDMDEGKERDVLIGKAIKTLESMRSA